MNNPRIPSPRRIFTRLKHVSVLKGRLGWQGLTADEYRDNGPYVVSSAHFQDDRIVWSICPRVAEERYRRDANIQLKVGDVLLMKDGAALGKLAFVDALPGPACLNSHLLLIRPRAGRFIPKFVYYLMTTPTFQDYLAVRGTGATFLGVSQEAIGNFTIDLPSRPAQTAVVEFLDRKTAAIDALIAKKERLIELLQEKQKALIAQAVTRGPDASVSFGEGGADWIRELPSHWQLLPLRRVLVRIEQGWSPVAEDRRSEADEWAVLKLSAVARGQFWPLENKALAEGTKPKQSIEVRPGDLLLTRANTPELVGAACYVRATRARLMLSDLIYRLTVNERLVSPAYLAYFLQSDVGRHQITRDARGSSQSMVKVSGAHIRSWLMPLPPLPEQDRIVAILDNDVFRIEGVVDRIKAHISLIREYRQALISAAVTGKIDIPSEEAA